MMNNKPTIVIPEDPKKRAEIIFALEYQLANDTNEKDREIHRAALEKLKAAKQKKPAEKVGFFIPSTKEKGALIYHFVVCAADTLPRGFG